MSNRAIFHRPFLFGTALIAATISLLALGLPGCDTQKKIRRQCTTLTPKTANEKIVHQAWYVVHIRGSKAGYSHTKTIQTTENEQPVYRTDVVNSLNVKKGRDTLKLTITLSTTSTLEGKLLHYHSRMPLGPSVTVSQGRVVGRELMIQLTVAGKTTRRTIELPDDLVVADAWRRSLMEKPMKAGERRVFRTFDPELGQLQTEEFVATGYEQVNLLQGSRKLLRLDHVMTARGGRKLSGTLWVDQHGLLLKTELIGIETYHTTRQIATEKNTGGQLNFFSDMTVKIARPLSQDVLASRVRYRVSLGSADPSELFSQGITQSVRRIDNRTAEIVIRTVDPNTPLDKQFTPSKKPTAADRSPNTMIQSDDSLVVAMAHQVAKDETNRWTLAKALEGHIHRSMREVNFTQAFATAAEVAKSRTGDCSEHAVLLTAVCRAREIPARVVVGLVYIPRSQAFGYHVWTEAWIAGRWLPLDATLERGGVGAGHLKIAATPLTDGLSDSAFLKIAQLLAADLKIEIIKTSGR